MNTVASGYDAIAVDFSRTRSKMWPEVARYAAMVPDGAKVLDLGCGNGRLYQEFAGRAIGSQVDYHGIDVSAGLITEAKRLHPEATEKFAVGTAVYLSFANEEFDQVFSIAVWHHLPSNEVRMKALQEVARVLKSGGTLVLTSWNLWQPKYWTKHLMGIQKLFTRPGHYEFGDIDIPWEDGTKFMRYCHAYSLCQLRRLLQQSGFSVLELYYSDASGKKTTWWKGRNIVVRATK
jgi:ubiquinone/menaquinone biosynthesis C-methylase UbiE